MTADRDAVPRITLAVVLAVQIVVGCRGREEAAPGGEGGTTAGDAAPEQQREPNYRGLIEEFRSVLAKDPHNLAAIIGLGNAHFASGRWGEAVLAYEQALRIDPHNAGIITDMGICYRNMGMYDEAIKAFDRALMFAPAHQEALLNLGAVYGYDKKVYGKAIDAWSRLLRVAPKHPRAEELKAAMDGFRAARKKGAR